MSERTALEIAARLEDSMPICGRAAVIALRRQHAEIERLKRERKYFDIACERISRAQAQGTLLPPEETRQPVQEGLL